MRKYREWGHVDGRLVRGVEFADGTMMTSRHANGLKRCTKQWQRAASSPEERKIVRHFRAIQKEDYTCLISKKSFPRRTR